MLIRLPVEDRIGYRRWESGIDEEELVRKEGRGQQIGNVIGWSTSGTGDFNFEESVSPLRTGISINLDSARRVCFTTKRTEWGLTHGDDFVLTGPTKKLTEFERKMTSVYPIKAKIISSGSQKSIKTLNRRLHWRKQGIVYQHDPRHVDMLGKDRGLEHGNSVQTLATLDVMEEEESEPLSQVQHHKCRSQVARCLFLSQDRADTTFIVNELCQKMSSPNQQSLATLKRLARYLKCERQW